MPSPESPRPPKKRNKASIARSEDVTVHIMDETFEDFVDTGIIDPHKGSERYARGNLRRRKLPSLDEIDRGHDDEE